MAKRTAIALFFMLSVACSAQTDNTFYAKAYPGRDVGSKVAAAMRSCNASISVPCIIVIDPSLAAFSAGTMPTLCAQCRLSDYRGGGPAMQGSTVNFQQENMEPNACLYPGTDIGAKTNAAIGSLASGCGSVLIPAGACGLTQSTVIVKPRCVSLHGQNAFGTVLNYTPVSGASIVVGDSGGVNDYPEGSISDLFIKTTTASSTAIGIYFGGDPAGFLSPTSGFLADFQNVNRVKVTGFSKGVSFGNNAFNVTINQSALLNNDTDWYFPSGLTNSGEMLVIDHSMTGNGTTAGIDQEGYSDLYVYGSSCDYNVKCAILNSSSHFFGVHFEQSSGTFISVNNNSGASVLIEGGQMLSQSATGSDTQMIALNNTQNPSLVIHNLYIHANHNYTDFLNWSADGGYQILSIENLPYWSYNGTSGILALTNAACTWSSCTIIDPTTGAYFVNSNYFSVQNGAVSEKSLQVTANMVNAASFQRLRVSSCTASTASTCTGTITWPVAFADTNYTADCGLTNTAGYGVVMLNGSTKTRSSIGYYLVNVGSVVTSSSSVNGTLECGSWHD